MARAISAFLFPTRQWLENVSTPEPHAVTAKGLHISRRLSRTSSEQRRGLSPGVVHKCYLDIQQEVQWVRSGVSESPAGVDVAVSMRVARQALRTMCRRSGGGGGGPFRDQGGGEDPPPSQGAQPGHQVAVHELRPFLLCPVAATGEQMQALQVRKFGSHQGQ